MRIATLTRPNPREEANRRGMQSVGGVSGMIDRVFGLGRAFAAGSADEPDDAALVRDFALAGQSGRDSIIRRQSAKP